MFIGNTDYKLIYLDTNAIREIVLNNSDSLKNFIEKFVVGDCKYAPIFSIYNVFELKPYEDIYNKFINVFSIIPCLMLFPYKLIIEEEHKAFEENRAFLMNTNLFNAFSSLGIGDSFNLPKFLERLWEKDNPIAEAIKEEIDGLAVVAKTWNGTKNEFSLIKARVPNISLRLYFFKNEKEAIKKDLNNHGIMISKDVNPNRLPGMRVMEYSHFMRVYDRKKPISPNDVMDVKMSCFIPYVDAVVTEGYQAELYRNMKSFIKELEKLEIYKVNVLKQANVI